MGSEESVGDERTRRASDRVVDQRFDCPPTSILGMLEGEGGTILKRRARKVQRFLAAGCKPPPEEFATVRTGLISRGKPLKCVARFNF
jgi:hypothetical protein